VSDFEVVFRILALIFCGSVALVVIEELIFGGKRGK
jgi:hypothetical protein